MSEQVEWMIARITKAGLDRHSEGAQATFGLSRARAIAKHLGPPWVVMHASTWLEPTEHEAWLKNPKTQQAWSP